MWLSCFTDPEGKMSCDDLCRTPETAVGLDAYIQCRFHCLTPDIAGMFELQVKSELGSLLRVTALVVPFRLLLCST